MSAASRFSSVFSLAYRIFARLYSRNFASILLRCSNYRKERGNIGVTTVFCPTHHNSHSRFASRHSISAYSSGVNATPSSSVSSNAITLAIAFSSFELYSYNSVNHITSVSYTHLFSGPSRANHNLLRRNRTRMGWNLASYSQ